MYGATIYGILCSGLSDKTKLSFVSANSSFIECVRKNQLFHLFSVADNTHSPTCTINGTAATTPDCNTSLNNFFDDTSLYVFTSCVWSACAGDFGTAICVCNPDIELTVNDCQFVSCEASSVNGSGIYAQSANIVHVQNSLFYDCKVLSGSNGEEGGGGIYLNSISTETLITTSDFIKCVVKYDGGGVNIWSSNSTNGNDKTFQKCRFIKCHGDNEYYSEGGGIMAYDNNYYIGITNCLFCECKNCFGGAVRISVPQDL